jgi:hypothetical protein
VRQRHIINLQWNRTDTHWCIWIRHSSEILI